MRPAACILAACVLAIPAALLWHDLAAPDDGARAAQDVAFAHRLLGRVPVTFVQNLGQWEHESRYVAHLGPMTVLLEERGWWVSVTQNAHRRFDPKAPHAAPEPGPRVRGAALRMTFEGSAKPELEGVDRLPGVHNYFLGKDPARWRTAVPRFGAVRYHELYAGVDLRAYGKDGHFEYDLVLAPGASLAGIEVRVEGADALRLAADGALMIDTPVGPVQQPRAVTHALDVDGSRREIACEYELRGKDRFGFRAPAWDGASELVLDPGLMYSTFLGGSDNDAAIAVSVDAAGVTTVAGYTRSPTFPTTPGAWDTTYNGTFEDAFVARLDPSLPSARQLTWSTFLGGADNEYAQGLSVDLMGVTSVMGITGSLDFPTTPNAWNTTSNGSYEVFVARLDPRRSGAPQLTYSTYLGAGDDDFGRALSVDAAGVATVVGETRASTFPTTPGAWDQTHNGLLDAFVARLDPRLPRAQQLVYSTFVGGPGDDGAFALSVDAVDVVTVAGWTASSSFPTTAGAWDTTLDGPYDAFVARLDPRLPGVQQLTYSTFLGGTQEERADALSLDASGLVTVGGFTSSSDFPTTPGSWDTTHNGSGDAFVVRLDPGLPSAQQLVYASFLGGSAFDAVRALSVAAGGVTTVAGWTRSTGFPTTRGAWDTTANGAGDAFVARIDPGLLADQQLVYSTFLGGTTSDDVAFAISVDALGVTTVAGCAESSDFPTTPGAFDTSHNGVQDAMVVRLDLLPDGVRSFGTSSPGCSGPLTIGVTSMPRLSNGTFTITCNRAPPSTAGALLLAARGLASPLRLLGVDVWVDLSSAWLVVPSAQSNGAGILYFVLPLPQDPSLENQQVNGQFAWLGPTSPPPCPPLGFATSNAIELTILR